MIADNLDSHQSTSEQATKSQGLRAEDEEDSWAEVPGSDRQISGLSVMESYLLALREQRVIIEALQRKFSFSAFDPIHLEYSFKFLPADIDYLCRQTGYTIVGNFTDPQERFIDSLWQVSKQVNSGERLIQRSAPDRQLSSAS